MCTITYHVSNQPNILQALASLPYGIFKSRLLHFVKYRTKRKTPRCYKSTWRRCMNEATKATFGQALVTNDGLSQVHPNSTWMAQGMQDRCPQKSILAGKTKISRQFRGQIKLKQPAFPFKPPVVSCAIDPSQSWSILASADNFGSQK